MKKASESLVWLREITEINQDEGDRTKKAKSIGFIVHGSAFWDRINIGTGLVHERISCSGTEDVACNGFLL